MESKHKRTQRDYSLAFKLSVVEQVEQGELTYKEAQRRYGIQGRSTVLVWLRKHGLQDWDVPTSRAGGVATMPDKTSKPQTPEQRIKALEAQLREATQKAQLFEAIIEQVKKNTGVDPLKKPLGRSSHKRSSRD
jgi:transposase-like protein